MLKWLIPVALIAALILFVQKSKEKISLLLKQSGGQSVPSVVPSSDLLPASDIKQSSPILQLSIPDDQAAVSNLDFAPTKYAPVPVGEFNS